MRRIKCLFFFLFVPILLKLTNEIYVIWKWRRGFLPIESLRWTSNVRGGKNHAKITETSNNSIDDQSNECSAQVSRYVRPVYPSDVVKTNLSQCGIWRPLRIRGRITCSNDSQVTGSCWNSRFLPWHPFWPMFRVGEATGGKQAFSTRRDQCNDMCEQQSRMEYIGRYRDVLANTPQTRECIARQSSNV